MSMEQMSQGCLGLQALVEVLQGLVHAGLAPQPEYLSAAAAALQSSELTLQVHCRPGVSICGKHQLPWY